MFSATRKLNDINERVAPIGTRETNEKPPIIEAQPQTATAELRREGRLARIAKALASGAQSDMPKGRNRTHPRIT